MEAVHKLFDVRAWICDRRKLNWIKFENIIFFALEENRLENFLMIKQAVINFFENHTKVLKYEKSKSGLQYVKSQYKENN